MRPQLRRWLSLLGAAVGASAAEVAPNIVVILADDLGTGDVGCYGATKVRTPAIDRLAREGIRFLDAHSPSSMCSPTRYALLTGVYAWRDSRQRIGVVQANDPLVIREGQPTLPGALKRTGYATAVVGKWHLGLGTTRPDWNGELKPGPLECGFDYFFGLPSGNSAEPNVFVENHRIVGLDADDPITHLETRKMIGGRAARWQHGHIDEVLAERAVGWIERQAKSQPGRPFFLYLATCSIHAPLVAHPRFRGTGEVGERGEFIHENDWLVGRVLDTLDRLRLSNSTLVVFSSDNGGYDPMERGRSLEQRFGHKPNSDLRGMKADVWEGGHRVPLLARWPGKIPAGRVSRQLVGLNDLFATLTEIAGARETTAPPDSISFRAALQGADGGQGARTQLVHHSGNGTLALRDGAWKLIPAQGSGGFTTAQQRRVSYRTPNPSDPSQPAGQLYQLDADPGETRNLYVERPEIVERMTRQLEHIRRQHEIRF